MTHNNDDHSKNFSFLYTEDQGWRLAPAYDLTYSDTYWGEHTTSVNGKGKNINEDDLTNVGTAFGIKEKVCRGYIDEIKKKTKALSAYLNAENSYHK